MNPAEKTRLALACPGCEGEVTSFGYAFTIIAPPKFEKYFVCDECASVLTGDDADARAALERTIFEYLAQGL